MRQGPHKNRSRSRGRRPTNNQSGRVYESNGPDVKVRGTAQTVADKYLQLARDAHSAGDTVMAEGYFQHAEHYLRILAATQPDPQQSAQQRRPGEDYSYEDGDEGDDEQVTSSAGGGNGEAQRQHQPQHQPQQQSQHQPQPQQPAAAPQADDSETADQPWGGPEPEFLRRGPGNGSGRSRRTRQTRGGNGQNQAQTGPDGSDDAGSAGDDAGSQGSSGQDSTEQA